MLQIHSNQMVMPISPLAKRPQVSKHLSDMCPKGPDSGLEKLEEKQQEKFKENPEKMKQT